MTPAQIEALDALDQAAQRLERANKEVIEAAQEHARATQKATRLCPHIFRTPKDREDD